MSKLIIVLGSLAIGLVVLFGLYLFLKGARNVWMALASVKWPTAPGVVVRSETARSVSKATRTSPGSVTFDTQTVIQYAVNGKDYTTDVLHFGQTLGSDDKSVAALQRLRYPRGKEVTVSYNPRSPWIAVMKPGLHAEAFWLVGAGLAFLLPAALCLMIGPSMVRSLTTNDQSFENSVHHAIEDAQQGQWPPNGTIPPPPDAGGDAVMAVVAVAFGALACGLGVLALTVGLQRIWHGSASQRWPTTQGVVIFAASGGGDSSDDATDDTSDPTSYARFVYQYEVAGTKHFNNVRRFAQVEGGSREEAERVAARYRKGAGVTVSYFPTDPDVAVLEPGNTSASLWVPGIGVVLLLFSLAIFIWVVPSVAKPIGG
jgi:hypothetical protein